MAQPAENTAIQVLVVGSVCGRFAALSSRISRLLQKHDFKAVFCVGSFFGTEPSPLDDVTFAIPTYFIAGDESDSSSSPIALLPNGGKLADNLFYLGRSGVTDVAGLRIAFLSGLHDAMHYNDGREANAKQDNKPSSFSVPYNKTDVEVLLDTEAPIDILLTTELGRGFHVFQPTWSDVSSADCWEMGSPVVSRLASHLCPRYHFASHHERHVALLPYRNRQPFAHVTRAFAFADFANKHKEKFMYACKLSPVASMSPEALRETPSGTTDCPYTEKARASTRARSESKEDATNAKRIRIDSADPFASVSDLGVSSSSSRWELGSSGRVPPTGYVCRRCQVPGHFIDECPHSDAAPPAGYVCRICNEPGHFLKNCPQKNPHADSNATCWFCLASPEVETHLIASIGEECYLAMPKGPLGDNHVLIIPIEHINSSVQLSLAAKKEIHSYKAALRKMFASNDSSCVIYERNVRTRGASHMHIQVVNVPNDVAEGDDAVSAFIVEASSRFNVKFERIQALDDVHQICGSCSSEFLVVELGARKVTRLLHRVEPGVRLPLQLLRELIAQLLRRPQLSDWKNCRQTKEQENDAVARFKQGFKPFDFTTN